MRNLLSYAGASANTGYFGIPATAILLGEDKLATAIFVIIRLKRSSQKNPYPSLTLDVFFIHDFFGIRTQQDS